MTTKSVNPNDPAFPQPMATSQDGSLYCAIEKHDSFGGISTRLYVAAKALQGLCAHPNIGEALAFAVPGGDEKAHVAHLAFRAVEAADALLAELERKPKTPV